MTFLHFIFYTETGDIVFTGTCLVLTAIGISIGGSYQVRNDDRFIEFRKPWLKVMGINVAILYAIWLTIESFLMDLPLALCLVITAIFGLLNVGFFIYGSPESIKFDLMERTCTHTHGWFDEPRVVKMGDILGLDLRTLVGDAPGYICRLRWQPGFFGWSEIGSFGKKQPAQDFMKDLSQKLDLPLTET